MSIIFSYIKYNMDYVKNLPPTTQRSAPIDLYERLEPAEQSAPVEQQQPDSVESEPAEQSAPVNNIFQQPTPVNNIFPLPDTNKIIMKENIKRYLNKKMQSRKKHNELLKQ